MPLVQIDLFPGRTVAQKQEIARLIIQAFVATLGSEREDVTVVFRNIARADWFVGDRLTGTGASRGRQS
jgi:phenylpyruvate tautomerase PptA (4-oxalocrotonate tautomerase family)